MDKSEVIKRIKSLEHKKETLARKCAWMSIYILNAKIETLKDKLKIEEMRQKIEDLELSKQYGESILKVESGQSESFEVDNVDELFKLIDKEIDK